MADTVTVLNLTDTGFSRSSNIPRWTGTWTLDGGFFQDGSGQLRFIRFPATISTSYLEVSRPFTQEMVDNGTLVVDARDSSGFPAPYSTTLEIRSGRRITGSVYRYWFSGSTTALQAYLQQINQFRMRVRLTLTLAGAGFPAFVGATDVTKAYVGSTEITKMYLGSSELG